MTAAAPTAGASRGSGRIWIVLVLAAIAVTVFVTPSSDEVGPYDLDSAGPDGYRGLRLLLEETGTDVDSIDADAVDTGLVADRDVVFVPEPSGAGADQVRRWRAFVAAGGRLVLGSPTSGIGAGSWGVEPYFSGGVMISPGVCTYETLEGGGRVALPPFVDEGVAARDGESCYGDRDVALVVRQRVDAGEVITFATPDLFTNEVMGAPAPDEPVGDIPDNAVLAQRAMGGAAGGNRLAVVTSGIEAAGTDGTTSLVDFISPGVKLGLLELGVALGWYAVARGRRHGRVVTEEVPVTIAGSAFVEAVGSLLERQGDHGRAAEVLRRGECRELSRRLGLPPTTSRRDLSAVLADRTGRPAADIERLLTEPVDSDTALVDTTRALDSLRQEALHV